MRNNVLRVHLHCAPTHYLWERKRERAVSINRRNIKGAGRLPVEAVIRANTGIRFNLIQVWFNIKFRWEYIFVINLSVE